MKFVDSHVCAAGKSCELCRKLTSGRSWRQIMLELFEVETVDFGCPKELAWTEQPPKPEVKPLPRLTPVPPPMQRYRWSGEWIEQHAAELRASLPVESEMVLALDNYILALGGDGCGGCRKRRTLRRLADRVSNIEGSELEIVERVLEKKA